jgi:hypothetical protein
LITTAGWIAEPVGKKAWLDALTGRMTLHSFDLRVLATQQFGDVAVAIAESAQEGTHDGKPFSLTFRYRVGAGRFRLGARDPTRLDCSAPVRRSRLKRHS